MITTYKKIAENEVCKVFEYNENHLVVFTLEYLPSALGNALKVIKARAMIENIDSSTTIVCTSERIAKKRFMLINEKSAAKSVESMEEHYFERKENE